MASYRLVFPATHWSAIRRAADKTTGQARRALEDLCVAYRPPLLAYVRRRGFDESEAEDVVQGFLAAFIAGQSLANADAGKGRFRTYLLASLKYYVAGQAAKAATLRRGGGVETRALADDLVDDNPSGNPETAYHHRWAQTVVGRIVEALGDEYRRAGKEQRYLALRTYLFDSDAPPYRVTARTLGMREGAVKVAVHRLRRRFGEQLRAEVAATVEEPTQIDGEIRALLASLKNLGPTP